MTLVPPAVEESHSDKHQRTGSNSETWSVLGRGREGGGVKQDVCDRRPRRSDVTAADVRRCQWLSSARDGRTVDGRVFDICCRHF